MRVVGHGKLLYDGTGGRTSYREVPFEGIVGCRCVRLWQGKCAGYYRLKISVGFKATYRQCEMKADIGLGGNKVAIKDLLLNYHFKHGVLSLGNAYEPYSMDMLISTTDMRFHQSAGSVLAFTDGRKLGLTYHSSLPFGYWATGLYTHNDINKIGDGQVNALVSTCGAFGASGGKGICCMWAVLFSFRTKPVNTVEPPTKLYRMMA